MKTKIYLVTNINDNPNKAYIGKTKNKDGILQVLMNNEVEIVK